LPGDFIGALPVKSVIHPAGLPITHLRAQVLRGPVESTLKRRIEFARTAVEPSGLGQRHADDLRSQRYERQGI
jgi:hypothetical protein